MNATQNLRGNQKLSRFVRLSGRVTAVTHALVGCSPRQVVQVLDASVVESLLLSCNIAGIEELIHSFSSDARDNKGRTLLMITAQEGILPVAAVLLQAGAQPNLRDGQGDTALHIAARYGRDDIAEILIESGADIDAVNNRGRSPLWVAASNNYPDSAIVDVLLKSGARTKLRDADGKAPEDLL